MIKYFMNFKQFITEDTSSNLITSIMQNHFGNVTKESNSYYSSTFKNRIITVFDMSTRQVKIVRIDFEWLYGNNSQGHFKNLQNDSYEFGNSMIELVKSFIENEYCIKAVGSDTKRMDKYPKLLNSLGLDYYMDNIYCTKKQIDSLAKPKHYDRLGQWNEPENPSE